MGIDDVITSTQNIWHYFQCKSNSEAERSQTTSTDQTTSEISTNTSNIHLTARVSVQIDSSLQGHLKALTKLTRGIERANHHSQLLQTAIDTKRPPRGLIPKVSPKKPDTPGSFTVWMGKFITRSRTNTNKEATRLLDQQSHQTRSWILPIYNLK